MLFFFSLQEKHVMPPDPRPVSCVPELLPTPSVQLSSRQTLQTVCQTPNGSSNHNANRYHYSVKLITVRFDSAVHWSSCGADVITMFYYHQNVVSFFSLSFVTPVIKRGLEVSSSAAAQHRTGTVRQPFTTLSQAPSFQTPQVEQFLREKKKRFLHVSRMYNPSDLWWICKV